MGFERSMHRAEHVLRPAPVRALARAWRQLGIATTRFGLFFARYEFEFGSQNAPQGQVFLFGLALLVDPFKK